jgi:Domain of unknown function (DUF4277)
VTICGFSNRRLYLVSQFLATKLVEHLLGSGITAAQLHDGCLGRTLDWLHWLYAHNPTALFAGIARQARRRFGIAARQAHELPLVARLVVSEHQALAIQCPVRQAGERRRVAQGSAWSGAVWFSSAQRRAHRPGRVQSAVADVDAGGRRRAEWRSDMWAQCGSVDDRSGARFRLGQQRFDETSNVGIWRDAQLVTQIGA